MPDRGAAVEGIRDIRGRGVETPSSGARGSQLGFTLLEVVVAVAVLGIFLGAAFELLAIGLRSARTSSEVTQAVLLARQKLDEVWLQQQQPRTLEGGASGAYRWSARLAPYAGGSEAETAVSDPAATLQQVSLRVIWPGGGRDRSLELTTVGITIDQEKLRPIGTPRSTAKSGTTDQRSAGQLSPMRPMPK